MNSARLEINVCYLNQVVSSKERILSLGHEFAKKYNLPMPHEIVANKGQKPHFDCDGIFYSLSHSGDYWVCVLSDCAVGIDLQRHQSCHRKRIAARFFHPNEASWLVNKPDDAFFEIWTAKESYVKYTGVGITDAFSHFSVVNDDGEIYKCEGAFLKHIPMMSEYTLCVCCSKPAQITMINDSIKKDML